LVAARDGIPGKPIAAKAFFCNIMIINAEGWGVSLPHDRAARSV